MSLATILSIIFSLFIIEVLLSIDNALVNATIAESLPEEKRKRAIRIGIILGALFRFVALFFAALIIQNLWIKMIGGLYLLYLAMAHLGKRVDEEGTTVTAKNDSYQKIIWQIAFADIVFSIDNVISAVSFSERIGIVILGVFIGMISMLFITPLLSRLIHKYRGMPQAAYAIVGFVGLTLILETVTSLHFSEGFKFGTILLIVAFTILYEHSPSLRKFSRPLLRSSQYLIALPLDIIALLQKRVVGLYKK